MSAKNETRFRASSHRSMNRGRAQGDGTIENIAAQRTPQERGHGQEHERRKGRRGEHPAAGARGDQYERREAEEARCGDHRPRRAEQVGQRAFAHSGVGMAVEHGMGVEDVRDEQSDGRADQQDRTVQHAARRILHAGHQQRTEQQPDDRFAQPAIAQAERPARIGDAEHRPDTGEGQRHDAPAGDSRTEAAPELR